MISSAHNAHLKLVRALHSSKGRRKEHAFFVEGVRLVEAAWQSGARPRFVLFAHPLTARAEALLMQMRQAGVALEESDARLLRQVSATESPQNLLAVLDWPQYTMPSSPNFLLILDQVRDPGNLGTLLRTAAAAGVQAVCIPPGSADPFAPKVLRAGMGAHFHLPILRQDWPVLLNTLRGSALRLFLADMRGEQTCWEADLTVPLGWIIGGEAEGACAAARQAAALSLRIPMPSAMESLNAAVAGSILIFETLRQREAKA